MKMIYTLNQSQMKYTKKDTQYNCMYCGQDAFNVFIDGFKNPLRIEISCKTCGRSDLISKYLTNPNE